MTRGFAVGLFVGVAVWVVLWEGVARKQVIDLVGVKLQEIIENPPADAPLVGALNDPPLVRTLRDSVTQLLQEKLP